MADVYSASESHPQSAFRRFERLPKELRLTIWEFSLPESRLIELLEIQKGTSFFLRTSATPPVLLHTCQEAASVARQHYQKLFDHADRPSNVYFSVMKDVLFISRYTFGSRYNLPVVSPLYDIPHLGAAVMNKVRTLALDPACFELDRALGDHAALPGASQGRGIFLPENWGTDEDEGEILWSLLFVLRFFSGVKELLLLLDERPHLRPDPSANSIPDPPSIHPASSIIEEIEIYKALEPETLVGPRWPGMNFSDSEEMHDCLLAQLSVVNEERLEAGRNPFRLPEISMGTVGTSEQLRELYKVRQEWQEWSVACRDLPGLHNYEDDYEEKEKDDDTNLDSDEETERHERQMGVIQRRRLVERLRWSVTINTKSGTRLAALLDIDLQLEIDRHKKNVDKRADERQFEEEEEAREQDEEEDSMMEAYQSWCNDYNGNEAESEDYS